MDPEAQARDHISRLTEVYASKTGLRSSTILARAANDARFLDRTASGAKTFTFRVYGTALRWFSDNWPDGADWPADVPRPEPSAPSTAPDPDDLAPPKQEGCSS